ncbi:MAG: endonuclease domain-containing protein [Desulfobacterales bacterium]|nr:endonuclease domain-containing protein [Desulfobacterales bacterium]
MLSTARHLRKNLTDAEQLLWRHIRGRQLKGYKFRRQSPVGKYIVDFVCFENRLVIELDGGQHARRRSYDHQREQWLHSQGFRVIRFWNHEVFQDIEAIKKVIIVNLTPHPDLPPQGGKEIDDSNSPFSSGRGARLL